VIVGSATGSLPLIFNGAHRFLGRSGRRFFDHAPRMWIYGANQPVTWSLPRPLTGTAAVPSAERGK
jgi:hypothetical protein